MLHAPHPEVIPDGERDEHDADGTEEEYERDPVVPRLCFGQRHDAPYPIDGDRSIVERAVR
jgi:hypothetical protein